MGDSGYTGIIGCYSLALYCELNHTPDHEPYTDTAMPWEYTGASEGYCNKQARRQGWVLDLTGQRAWCPTHRLQGLKVLCEEKRQGEG